MCVRPIVTSQVLLLQFCDVIENNSIGNDAVNPLVEKFKSLVYVMSGSHMFNPSSLLHAP